jgi:hypothetical protein
VVIEDVSQVAREPLVTGADPAPVRVIPVVCQPEAASNPGAHSTWKLWKPVPAAVPVMETMTPFLNVVGEVGEGGGIGLMIEAFREFEEAGSSAGCMCESFAGV